MLVVVIAVTPLLLGMLVILLIARYSPNVPRTAPLGEGEMGDQRPQITGDEFKDLIEELIEALGLETVFSSMGTGGVIEMTLRDPKPLTGGRIVLQASPVLQGQVDAVDVLGFAEGVRADMGALKGIFIALAGFTPEARAGVSASPAPVDLVDGGELMELMADHLEPARVAQVGSYRGFGSG